MVIQYLFTRPGAFPSISALDIDQINNNMDAIEIFKNNLDVRDRGLPGSVQDFSIFSGPGPVVFLILIGYGS